MAAIAATAGAVAWMALLGCVGAAATEAEVGYPAPTVQAQAANAVWLAYAPPPPTPGVVCMIDSGVDPNPDTEAAVVGSASLYPETGTGDEIAALSPRVQPGDHPDGHGTLMAMLMAAPHNGWGMVGIAPSAVRVYNMKALQAGSVDFSNDVEAQAIAACRRLHSGSYPGLVTVSMSLAAESIPSSIQLSQIDSAITFARNDGISVVAAADNEGGAAGFPASFAPVVSVGAADAGVSAGTVCSFSATEGLDLLAPGCDTRTGGIEGAFEDTGEPDVSQGTSQATAITAAVLAAIRAYRPTLTMSQAEGCLTATTTGGELDAAAAFEACGLGTIVAESTEAEPRAGVPGGPESAGTGAAGSSASKTTVTVQRCAGGGSCSSGSSSRGSTVALRGFEEPSCSRPRLSVSRDRGRRMRIVARSVPRHCRLRARIRHARAGVHLHVRRRRPALLVLTAPARAGIEVRLVPTHGSRRTPSRWVPVPLHRAGRSRRGGR